MYVYQHLHVMFYAGRTCRGQHAHAPHAPTPCRSQIPKSCGFDAKHQSPASTRDCMNPLPEGDSSSHTIIYASKSIQLILYCCGSTEHCGCVGSQQYRNIQSIPCVAGGQSITALTQHVTCIALILHHQHQQASSPSVSPCFIGETNTHRLKSRTE